MTLPSQKETMPVMFWSVLMVVVAAITLGVSWLGGVRQLVPVSIGASGLSALLFVVAGVRERARIRRARKSASPGEAPRVRTVPPSKAATATPAKTPPAAATPTKTRAAGGAAARRARRPVVRPSEETTPAESPTGSRMEGVSEGAFESPATTPPETEGVKVLRPSPAVRRRPVPRPAPPAPEPTEQSAEAPVEPASESLPAAPAPEEPDMRAPAPIDFEARLPWDEEEDEEEPARGEEDMVELRELLREAGPPEQAEPSSVDEPTQLIPLDDEMAPASTGTPAPADMRESPAADLYESEPEIVAEVARAATPEAEPELDALELELPEVPAAHEPEGPPVPEISEPAAAVPLEPAPPAPSVPPGAPVEEEEPGIVVVQQVGGDLRMHVARPSTSKPKPAARKKPAASKAKAASAKSAAAKAKPKAKPAAKAKPTAKPKAKPAAKPKPKVKAPAKAKPKAKSPSKPSASRSKHTAAPPPPAPDERPAAGPPDSAAGSQTPGEPGPGSV